MCNDNMHIICVHDNVRKAFYVPVYCRSGAETSHQAISDALQDGGLVGDEAVIFRAGLAASRCFQSSVRLVVYDLVPSFRALSVLLRNVRWPRDAEFSLHRI
ncbi:hypothetical protein BAUCODRAFT_356772 [Baudoinia panamericana UAMH 10762]|uniref:Uncharacterized protein n=1 Tax=Baudoinia panamericana (strain UAMH 10762) TaxID=717646 RepID=M2LZ28_BAUPA|nr:uncharacterized protein BAUCODRAFT_356772 [Baudoinia panamericana UAMH 10762]EMC99947.1 hypothetical protein BAUCODRAFT_356772 [Baudoinia panamericana UAMH 10762]